MIRRVIFWQNLLVHHQSAYIRALAARGAWEVIWVVQDETTPHTRSLGYPIPDAGQVRVIIAPSQEIIQTLIATDPEESVHILSGFYGTPLVEKALPLCLKSGATVGIMSESLDPRGIKGMLRHLRGRWEGLRLCNQIDFVLPMGEVGRQDFIRFGFPAEKIFPFAYCTEDPAEEMEEVTAKESFGMLYIGQYIHRKGIDVLLRALADCPRTPVWHLKLVGNGNKQEHLAALSHRFGLDDMVTFHPALPNADAMRLLRQSDLLLLPSRYDGWGAVVNEALQRGVPILCSDACGAGVLLQESWRGTVLPHGSVSFWQTAIEKAVARGKLTSASRQRIRNWSRCISGASLADYLSEILLHITENRPRPLPVWERPMTVCLDVSRPAISSPETPVCP